VTYREANGRNQAVSVRPISSAGSGNGPKSEAAKIVDGTVTSITAGVLTLDHDGRALTFAVDAATTVSAPGAGKASRAAGGRLPITELVGKGDIVNVVYRDAGTAMSASQVRIRARAHH
jgi:predicted RecA/RadA family phage recombinase